MSSAERFRIATVRQMAEIEPYRNFISQSALRALIFNAEPRRDGKGKRIPGNGLLEAGAIIRVGRKVLLNLDAFDAWLRAKTCKSPENPLRK